MTPLNLAAYLARLGCTGSREPTPALLADILCRHVGTIPFENPDVLPGRPIRTDRRPRRPPPATCSLLNYKPSGGIPDGS